MVGAYVAATIVTLVQYLRLRDKRLLPLVALFAFQAQALDREWFDVWKAVYQNAACLAGLAMVVLLTLRPGPPASPPHSASPAAPPAASGAGGASGDPAKASQTDKDSPPGATDGAPGR
jgi:hypothetical protein